VSATLAFRVAKFIDAPISAVLTGTALPPARAGTAGTRTSERYALPVQTRDVRGCRSGRYGISPALPQITRCLKIKPLPQIRGVGIQDALTERSKLSPMPRRARTQEYRQARRSRSMLTDMPPTRDPHASRSSPRAGSLPEQRLEDWEQPT
jgi:hypothetical protein